VANLNRDELRRLARLGAMARLTQIRAEEAAIREEFPELFGGSAAKAARRQGRRGRKGMSAAARKAVSERMRKYWAERRKAKAK
jgi:hypothetical protein